MPLLLMVAVLVVLAAALYRLGWALGWLRVALVADLLVLTPLLASRLIPVPLLPWVYRALGAKVGRGTHIVGLICDPPLTTIGARCLIGSDAMLAAHAMDDAESMTYAPIALGDDVLIGAKAIVLAGCTIGHGARVGAGAVVTKHTVISDGETWAGIPARRYVSGVAA
jgi:hypothetical protein